MKFFFIFLSSIFTFSVYSQTNCTADFNLIVEGVKFSSDLKSAEIESCIGVPITILADSLPGSKIQWYLNSKKIEGEFLTNLVTTEAGKYNARMEHNGCVYYSTILESIKVESFGLYLTRSSLETDSVISLCNGGSVKLGAVRESIFGGYKITYYKDSERIYSFDNIKEPGVYYARAESGACQVTSNFVKVIRSDSMIQKPDWNFFYKYKGDTIYTCEKTYSLYYDFYGQSSIFKDDALLEKFEEGKSLVYTIKESGNYWFQVVQGKCVYKSRVVNFSFGNKTSMQFSLDTIPKCVFSTSLQVRAESMSEVLYCDWFDYKTNKPVQGYNNTFYPQNPGIYYVKSLRPDCQYIDNKIEIKSVLPDFKLQISNSTGNGEKSKLCTGSKIVIFSNLYYTPKSFYWTKNGQIIYNLKSTFSSIIIKQSGIYQLYVDFGSCKYISNEIKMVVDESVNELGPVYIQYCDSSKVILSASNAENVKYRWFLNYTVLENESGKNLNITPKDAGVFKVVLESICYSKAFNINVGVKIDAVNPTCVGSKIRLIARGQSGQYEWRGPGNFRSLDKENSINIESEKQFGIYFVRNKTDNCVFESILEVTKKKIDSVFIISKEAIICEFQNFTFPVRSDKNFNYYWSGPNGYSSNSNVPVFSEITTRQSGLYKLFAKDSDNCSATDSLKLSVKKYEKPTAVLKGGGNFTTADSVQLDFDLESYSPWELKLSDSTVLKPLKSPFQYKLLLEKSSNISIASLKNICGLGSWKGEAIFNLVLGLDEQNNKSIKVYPVPSTGIIKLKCDMDSALDITIFDSYGRKLFTKYQFYASDDYLNLNNFPKGVYYILSKNSSGLFTNKVIIE